MAPLGSSLAEQQIGEHLRRQALRASRLQRGNQSIQVHRPIEQLDAPPYLGMVARAQMRPDRLQVHRRHIGIGLHRQDRQGIGKTVEQARDRRLRFETGRQHQPGQLRVIGRLIGLQHRQDHVGAIAWRDDQMIVAQPFDCMLGLHRSDQVVIDERIEPVCTVEHLGPQLLRHFRDPRTAQRPVKGHHAERPVLMPVALTQSLSQGFDVGRIGFGDDRAEDFAAAETVRVERDPHRTQRFLDRPPFGTADDQHRAGEVLGDFPVEVELEGRCRLDQEIGPFDQHEVAGILQRLVLRDDPLDDLVRFVFAEQTDRGGRRKPERGLVSLRQPEMPQDQIDVLIPFLAGISLRDGPEERDPGRAALRHIEYAEGDQRLARPGAGGADVKRGRHALMSLERNSGAARRRGGRLRATPEPRLHGEARLAPRRYRERLQIRLSNSAFFWANS